MKITYDMQEDEWLKLCEERDVVAFIDECGDLCINGDAGESIMITSSGAYVGVLSFISYMEQCEVVKIFYRGSGDSVTITF